MLRAGRKKDNKTTEGPELTDSAQRTAYTLPIHGVLAVPAAYLQPLDAHHSI